MLNRWRHVSVLQSLELLDVGIVGVCSISTCVKSDGEIQLKKMKQNDKSV